MPYHNPPLRRVRVCYDDLVEASEDGRRSLVRVLLKAGVRVVDKEDDEGDDETRDEGQGEGEGGGGEEGKQKGTITKREAKQLCKLLRKFRCVCVCVWIQHDIRQRLFFFSRVLSHKRALLWSYNCSFFMLSQLGQLQPVRRIRMDEKLGHLHLPRLQRKNHGGVKAEMQASSTSNYCISAQSNN